MKGGLLQWLIGKEGKKLVGVINFPAIKMNKDVISHLLHSWCPDAEDRKTVSISCVKPQAGSVASNLSNIFGFHLMHESAFTLSRFESSVEISFGPLSSSRTQRNAIFDDSQT